ncbi:MAG: SUMF1/EgtB/PvdO family nonheme iron enzyme [Saprospiraceae bacterium]|nr:SUMF1/EgtB/PvdO family nonheme iron enzyme [Saprospiraceae bacterium]
MSANKQQQTTREPPANNNKYKQPPINYLHHISSLLKPDSLHHQLLTSFVLRFQNDRYGVGHFLFACYAAVPLFLTPDLLHKLWFNFRSYQDEAGEKRQIERVAVADLLLSGLLEQKAVEVYEFPAPVRHVLLSCLEKRFAQGEKLKEIARFLLYYVRSYQLEGESISAAIREAQEWNALAYLNPQKAAREIRQALRHSAGENAQTRQLRIGSILRQIDEQYAVLDQQEVRQNESFQNLVAYSRGMNAYIRGNQTEALGIFGQLQSRTTREMSSANTQRIFMPVPKVVEEALAGDAEAPKTPASHVHALLIGIDEYRHHHQLAGCVYDRNAMADLLSDYYSERLTIYDIPSGDDNIGADDVLSRLKEALRESNAGDVLLFYFSGHGINRAQGGEENAILFSDFNPDDPQNNAHRITESRFRQVVVEAQKPDLQVVVILDTHAGSEGWLEEGLPNRVIISSCNQMESAKEIRIEEEDSSRVRGIFSYALEKQLKRTRGGITYHLLMHLIRKEVVPQGQTPQLFAGDIDKNHAFLSAYYSVGLRLQELLRETGYYEGPIDGKTGPQTQKSIEGFREEYGLEEREDLEKALEKKLLLSGQRQMEVLFLGNYQIGELEEAFDQLFGSLDYSCDRTFYRPQDPQALKAQKNLPLELDPEEKDKGKRMVFGAHFIVLLVDEFFLYNQAYEELIDYIRQRRQTDPVPVFAMALDDADWRDHPVARLTQVWWPGMGAKYFGDPWGIFSAERESPEESMVALTNALDQLKWNLDDLGRFLPPDQSAAFLKKCGEFENDMSISKFDRLGTALRKMAGEMPDADFMVEYLRPEAEHAYIYGAACALQTHPLPRYFEPLVDYLAQVADEDLLGLRLRLLYRLIMVVEKIAREDNKGDDQQLDREARVRAISILEAINRHPRCVRDNETQGKKGIGNRIEMTIKQLGEPIQDERALEIIIEEKTEKARESKTLMLEDLGLREIPDVVYTLEDLEKLSLKGNRIRYIPEAIGQLKQLRELDLARNNIAEIGALAELPQLKGLYLFKNEIENIQPLARLRELKNLNLSTNRIREIDAIGSMPLLEGLDLDSNEIEDIAPLLEIENPEWIDLRFNRIDILPPEIVQLGLSFKWVNDYMEGLILEGNPLDEEIIALLQKDPEIVRERLQRQLFQKRLEEAFSSSRLDLSKLQLEELPEEVRKASGIEVLILSDNRLEKLPDWLAELQQLRELDLSENQLSVLPSTLDSLSELRKINCDHNKLTNFPPGLLHLVDIEEISLQDNQIESVPQPVAFLNSLRKLNLRGNPVENIPKDILESGDEQVLEYIRRNLGSASESMSNSVPPEAESESPAEGPETDSPPDMILIEGGSFDMGDVLGESTEEELPVHKVEISDFYLAPFPVTFEHYDRFCELTGREQAHDEDWGRGLRPAINLSWYDAAAYCNWLSEQHDLQPVYLLEAEEIEADFEADGFRLPTEAEWEYAARQRGDRLRFGNGEDIARPSEINFDAREDKKESYSEVGPFRAETIPVGSLGKPNALGLHDMSGNVWEWCWDWYDPNYYQNSPVRDPRGPAPTGYRVMRGGSWFVKPSYLRCTARNGHAPTASNNGIGFRLCRTKKESTPGSKNISA